MTEKQKEDILLSIRESLSSNNRLFEKIFQKLEEHDKRFKIIEEKLESRDELLVSITKELALLKKDMNEKFEDIDKKIKVMYQELEYYRKNDARLENDIISR